MTKTLFPLATIVLVAIQGCSTVPTTSPVTAPQQARVVRTAPPAPPAPPIPQAPTVRTAPLSIAAPSKPVQIQPLEPSYPGTYEEQYQGSYQDGYQSNTQGNYPGSYNSQYPQDGYPQGSYSQDSYSQDPYSQSQWPSTSEYPQQDGYTSDTADSYSQSMPIEPPPRQSAVVNSILAQADTQQGSGKLDQAAASIERGLRIEPRNAVLWGQLAALRVEQNRPDQAEALAKKAIRFAQGNGSLLKSNWLTIAAARRLNGDPSGASTAERTAAQY